MIYENVTDKHLTDMLHFINNKMEFEKWYPVKSDIGYNTIIELFDSSLIENCEFNGEETHFRKVDLTGFVRNLKLPTNLK